jgi:hypothetical protein
MALDSSLMIPLLKEDRKEQFPYCAICLPIATGFNVARQTRRDLECIPA